MSRFVFKLQRVLDLRTQAVDEAQAYLRHCQKIRSELQTLLIEQRDAYITEREQLNAVIRQGEHFKYGAYELSLESRKSKMLELLQAIKVADQDVDLAESHLLACKRNLKVIENFRDKKALEHLQKEELKERNFLDEQATLRQQRAQFNSSR